MHDVYATRETITAVLEQHGIDPQGAWPLVLDTLLAELPSWAVNVALRVAGADADSATQIAPRNLPRRRPDNKSGFAGVDLHRPDTPRPWRSRIWRGGRCVWSGHFVTAERAAEARAEQLRAEQC